MLLAPAMGWDRSEDQQVTAAHVRGRSRAFVPLLPYWLQLLQHAAPRQEKEPTH